MLVLGVELAMLHQGGKKGLPKMGLGLGGKSSSIQAVVSMSTLRWGLHFTARGYLRLAQALR